MKSTYLGLYHGEPCYVNELEDKDIKRIEDLQFIGSVILLLMLVASIAMVLYFVVIKRVLGW